MVYMWVNLQNNAAYERGWNFFDFCHVVRTGPLVPASCQVPVARTLPSWIRFLHPVLVSRTAAVIS